MGLALAASWFSVWGSYAAYTWTADPFRSALQVTRFYVPAAGAISLLGSWLFGLASRLGAELTAALVAGVGLGVGLAGALAAGLSRSAADDASPLTPRASWQRDQAFGTWICRVVPGWLIC